MKQCKILHINDGNGTQLHNGNRLFIEEFLQAEETITQYLNEGWVVKHMIPDISPNTIETGTIAFFHTGFVVYLEKDDSKE